MLFRALRKALSESKEWQLLRFQLFIPEGGGGSYTTKADALPAVYNAKNVRQKEHEGAAVCPATPFVVFEPSETNFLLCAIEVVLSGVGNLS